MRPNFYLALILAGDDLDLHAHEMKHCAGFDHQGLKGYK